MKEEQNALVSLNRIEGQIRGIKKMVEEDRGCEDVITQLFAVSGAINSLAKKILYSHIKGCVVESILEGKEEHGVNELVALLDQLFKMKA